MRWYPRLRVSQQRIAHLRLYSTASQNQEHAPAPADITLRPYQSSCLDACVEALESGCSRIGVSLPTGSGKTTVFVTLLSRLKPPAERPHATRSLVLVNTIELARQTAVHTGKLWPDWSVEIEQGTKYQASGLADLTVATYQTLLRPNRLAKFDPAALKAVIVDEAHHAASPAYRHILSRFHQDIKSSKSDEDDVVPFPPLATHSVPIIGFSATFSRNDGLALGSVFERIVYHRDFLEMIQEKWLCNVRFTSIQAKIDLSAVTVNSRSGDFNPTSLASVINTPTINALVVQTWLDRASMRRSTLIFCANLAHVRELTSTFRAAGIDARYVHSGTHAADRKTLIAAFKAGEFPVLVNCAILTEGADIPNIDCIILARPTRSRNVFAQMIGRGMRQSPDTGKDDCHLIDFVDSLGRMPGVVSVPSLFGLDPSELVQDETLEAMQERAAERERDIELQNSVDSVDAVPDPKYITYIDYEDPFSFIHQSSGAPNIHKYSSHSWVGCGDEIYVLECMGKGFIRIEPIEEPEGPAYRGVYTPATLPMHVARTLKLAPFSRSRPVVTASTLYEAVKACDTFARQVVGNDVAMGMLRTAKWRRHPATETQKNFIKKRWEKRAQQSLDEVKNQRDVSTLTKGEAANIITRLKHGAQARYAKKMKAERKALAVEAKERKRWDMENVAVGPLLAS